MFKFHQKTWKGYYTWNRKQVKDNNSRYHDSPQYGGN